MTREDLPHRVKIERTPEQVAEEEAIHRRFRPKITLAELVAMGEITEDEAEEIRAHRAQGPPEWPLRDLVAALRAERERRGWSYADLARASGIDRAAIHKLEIGLNRNPTVATLDRLAAAMGMRIGWSLEPVGAGHEGPDAGDHP